MLLSSAKAAPSCDIVGDGRRVMETIYWAAITYYSTIVYFHLCFDRLLPDNLQTVLMPQEKAVSLVLELSLKLHRSRPHLMVRITWPLFMAGVATADRIYQDWVSIRRESWGGMGRITAVSANALTRLFAEATLLHILRNNFRITTLIDLMER